MKILWFTWKDLDNPLAGGAEVVNEELAARLAKDGHDVVFIVSGFKGHPASVARRGFRIRRVGRRFTSYVAAAREYHRRWQSWADLVIDECNTMPYFTSRYAKGPHLLFFHMLNRRIWFHEFPQPFSSIGYAVEPLYLRLLKRRTPIVTVSESTKQDLMKHGFKADDIKIITQGIQLKPVPELDSIQKADKPTMLSFGSIRPMKRTHHQLEAFELAKSFVPDLQFIIAGNHSSKYAAKLKEAITRSPHKSDIQLLGSVTQEQKIELMRKAHLLAVTSVKEGWGLVVTEAASQGTPSVVYNVDGLRDSVKHDKTGLITTENTPGALAESIALLLRDPEHYAQLQRAGWEWSQNLNFDKAYEDFKSIITQTIN